MDRPHNLVIPVTRDELDRAHRLADVGDEALSQMVRRWIRTEYQKAFGAEAPPPAKLKHGPKSDRG